jgi:chromosomal replication initiator protein
LQLSPKEAWKRILDEARRELPDQAVTTWLAPAEPLGFEDGRLILGLPDEFAVKWNEAKHASLLSRLAGKLGDQPLEVGFRVSDERLARPQIDFFVAPPADEATAPAAKAASASLPLNERYSFESFGFGKSNEHAAAAAYAVSEAPGNTYNPLLI